MLGLLGLDASSVYVSPNRRRSSSAAVGPDVQSRVERRTARVPRVPRRISFNASTYGINRTRIDQTQNAMTSCNAPKMLSDWHLYTSLLWNLLRRTIKFVVWQRRHRVGLPINETSGLLLAPFWFHSWWKYCTILYPNDSSVFLVLNQMIASSERKHTVPKQT